MADVASTEAPVQNTPALEPPQTRSIRDMIQEHVTNQQAKSEPSSEPAVATDTPEVRSNESEEGEQGTQVVDEFEKYVEELFASEPEAKDSGDDDLDESGEFKEIEELDVKSKANQRIRKQNARMRAAEEKAKELEASVVQLKQHAVKQATVLKKALAKLQQAQKAEQQPRVSLDAQGPEAQLEALFEQKYGNKFSQMEQRIAQYERAAQNAKQEQELSQVEAQLLQEAQNLRPRILPGLPEDAYRDNELGTALDEFLMTRAVGTNRSQAEVVPEVREFVKAVLKWGMKGARDRGRKLQNNQGVPNAMAPGSAPGKQAEGSPMYSLKQLNDAGYAHQWAARRDGYRKLQNVAPSGGWQ